MNKLKQELEQEIAECKKAMQNIEKKPINEQSITLFNYIKWRMFSAENFLAFVKETLESSINKENQIQIDELQDRNLSLMKELDEFKQKVEKDINKFFGKDSEFAKDLKERIFNG